jgi:mannose-6-phosphate isomerase-like protein (cupin superfamily)
VERLPVIKTLLLATLAAGVATTALAQTPPPATTPREPPSNTQSGVNINRFIVYADRTPSTVVQDTMLKQTLLTAGDPHKPGDPGAVLTFRKEIALNTLQPGEVTSIGTSADQMVFYVESGEGRLDDGKSWWALKPGITILAPPGVGFRFQASGKEPLKMISAQTPVYPGVAPKTAMIVRDVTRMAYTERNVHWSNMAKYVFAGEEAGGLPGDRVYLVYMGPMTIAGPHAHTPGQEEVWIKVSDGPALMQMGSEIRDWPINAGFMAPPNGQTVHAAINLDKKIGTWLYLANLNPNAPITAPGAPPPPPPGGGTRPPPPPAIAEGLAASTIAGTPLAPPAPAGRR